MFRATQLAIMIAAGLSLMAQASPAQATSVTTFVSGTGHDTGACPATAPCKTFQYANGQTTSGGTITVLTSGSFGPVNITKSLSIVAKGVEAMIQSATACPGGGSAAICVSVATHVSLRGLTIDLNNLSSTHDGIRFNSGAGGAALHVHDCTIRRLGGNGIVNETTTASTNLFVSNCVIADNKGIGVSVFPKTDGTHIIILDRVHVEKNATAGVEVEGSLSNGKIFTTIRDSVIASNGDYNVDAFLGHNEVTIERTAITNADVGLRAVGVVAYVRFGESSVTANTTAFAHSTGGTIQSFGNNKISGNGTNGSFSTVILQ